MNERLRQMAGWIAITEICGILGWLASGNIMDWYDRLEKPPISPQLWFYVIIWVVIYAMNGMAVCGVYRSIAPLYLKRKAIRAYGIQLFIHFIWYVVLFRLSIWGGAVILTVLNLLSTSMIGMFYKIKKSAAYLLIPYTLGNAYVMYLNLGIALLNH